MKKIKSGLINAAFFIAGDIAYSLFSFQHKSNPVIFFGAIIIILLFFMFHKLDNLVVEHTPAKKILLKEKKYTNWLVSAVIGAGFAFSSNGSTLLRWMFGSS